MEEKIRYFSNSERVSAVCREIYSGYGYRQYKMSRFEEYDLYAANRDFLIDDSTITFTGSDGKLMALKPDVTLSIVKNAAATGRDQEKVFYLENVYRKPKSNSDFKEIMQLGLECIGDIGLYQMGEVISLAAQSLSVIDENYILDISHMGIISALADLAGIYGAAREGLIKFINGKNAAGVRAVCDECGAEAGLAERLVRLTGVYGPFKTAMPQLRALSVNEATDAALDEIRGIYEILEVTGCAGRVNLDFSHTGDMNYYNGVTFCGYIEGIPSAVLSGGRYDRLLRKFGKPGGAIGFAIYLDLLDLLPQPKREYDVDVLLVCGEHDGVSVARAVQRLRLEGKSVLAVSRVPENGITWREAVKIEGIMPEDKTS